MPTELAVGGASRKHPSSSSSETAIEPGSIIALERVLALHFFILDLIGDLIGVVLWWSEQGPTCCPQLPSTCRFGPADFVGSCCSPHAFAIVIWIFGVAAAPIGPAKSGGPASVWPLIGAAGGTADAISAGDARVAE